MVLAEAQAMGVPVLTSRLVGASECLPDAYASWLLDRPEPPSSRRGRSRCSRTRRRAERLAAAAAATVVAFDERSYAEGTRRLVAARTAGSGTG